MDPFGRTLVIFTKGTRDSVTAGILSKPNFIVFFHRTANTGFG